MSLLIRPGLILKLTDWVKRHPLLTKAMWLNCSNCSPDNMYWSPLNIWYVNSSSFFITGALCWNWTVLGNTKGKAFTCLWPKGAGFSWVRPVHSCYVIWCDTRRDHYPHTVLACCSVALPLSPGEPALTAMSLRPQPQRWCSTPPLTHRPLD